MRVFQRFRRLTAILLCCCLLPVCAMGEGTAAVPSATPVTEAAPTATFAPVTTLAANTQATATPSPSPAATATPSPTPAPTATPEPTATPAPTPDDSAVTRSDFTMSLNLHADAFPDDGQTDIKGWEEFLKKLEFRGVVDTQRFPDPQDRVYMEGALYLNGRETIPLIYEGYHSYRYIRSPAIGGQSLHFQMNNFFEFMLKPYYFMDMPTQYIALLMYPEATAYLLQAYGDPIRECLNNSGSGSRTVSYVELYELCETLDQLAMEDPDFEPVYFYLTALLVDLQASDSTYDRFCYLEDYLDYLDPTQDGMTITQEGNTETYAMGGHTLFTITRENDTTDWKLTLPSEDDFTLTITYQHQPKAVGEDTSVHLTVTTPEDTRIDLSLEATGLPKADDLTANGNVTFTVGGSAFEDAVSPYAFDFRMTRSAAETPCHLTLGIDWLHPQTGKPGITFLWNADMETLAETALVDHVYDNQLDFFHLNEGYLDEYKKAFALPLTLAFAPIVLEMPSGVINDVVRFANDSGILASLGIE